MGLFGLFWLFGSEAFDGVGKGGFEGLEADSEKRDLLRALDDVIGGQTKQTKAGDDDGQPGKEAEDGAEAFVFDVLFVEVFERGWVPCFFL
jgi:hypothetical protein